MFLFVLSGDQLTSWSVYAKPGKYTVTCVCQECRLIPFLHWILAESTRSRVCVRSIDLYHFSIGFQRKVHGHVYVLGVWTYIISPLDFRGKYTVTCMCQEYGLISFLHWILELFRQSAHLSNLIKILSHTCPSLLLCRCVADLWKSHCGSHTSDPMYQPFKMTIPSK